MPKAYVDKDGRFHRELRTETKNQRYVAFLEGRLSADQLDDEELMRGQIREDSGRFGKGTNMVPRKMLNQLQKTTVARTNDELRKNAFKSAESLTDIATNKAYEPKDRLKAAMYLLDRVLGKTPQQVTITEDRRYEIMLSGLESGVRAERQEERKTELPVYAEIVENDDSSSV